MFEVIGYVATIIAITVVTAHLITKVININKKDKISYLDINHYCGWEGVTPDWTIIPTIEVSFSQGLYINFKFLKLYFYISYQFISERKDDYLSEARVKYYKETHEIN